MFCGWDWGSTHHGVCVIDDHGTIIKQWLVQHTHDDLGQLFGELAALADPLDLPVAIERSEGLVVGLIAAAGHPVLMAEPAGFNAARPRWGSIGTKSDAGDAFMLADYARTDGHRLRRVAPVAEATRELGVLVRARACVVEARTTASNQLWAVLAEHWPGAAGLFQKLTSKITLAFLTDYPTPQAAARLGEGRMGQFCRRHAYRGGKPPAELIKRLRAAPAAASPISPEILAAIVAGSVAQIRVLNAEIRRLENAIEGTTIRDRCLTPRGASDLCARCGRADCRRLCHHRHGGTPPGCCYKCRRCTDRHSGLGRCPTWSGELLLDLGAVGAALTSRPLHLDDPRR